MNEVLNDSAGGEEGADRCGPFRRDANRRQFVGGAAVLLGGIGLGSEPGVAQAADPGPRARPKPPVRIATEEAFVTPEINAATLAYMAGEGRHDEPALAMARTVTAPAIRDGWNRRLTDFGALRLQEMDDAGIAMQILLLSSPGVQIFPADQAVELARRANDTANQLCRSDPRRFAALAAIAPQSPTAAADELTRSVKQLGCRGAMINSHTKGEYLDDPKFWPIFEAAQSLDVPIYLHPREPSPAMAGPFLPPRVTGSIWGYAAETGLHALRLILGQVFDNFPRLQIILGHAGESLPFFADRIDVRYAVELAPGGAKSLKFKPSHYLRENFIITTSGMNWKQPVELCLSVMGPERVMFAADWPFENARDAVTTFDAIGLEDSLARRVYEGNARRVFRLDA
jgi:2,3-dihydroxybenzoate decarboxylase